MFTGFVAIFIFPTVKDGIIYCMKKKSNFIPFYFHISIQKGHRYDQEKY